MNSERTTIVVGAELGEMLDEGAAELGMTAQTFLDEALEEYIKENG